MRTQLATLALSLSLASNAVAQSLNIDFGAAGSAPTASYAAAGLAGTWNEIAVLPPGQRAPLVGLDGASVAAQIYMIGGTALLASDDPATTGDDNAFVDDMLIGFNNPTDVCVWVENLVNGNYTVVLYALTPNDPSLTHRVRVDFATPDATMIGGAWPGGHVDGVSYLRFAVPVTNGKIGLHSGLPSGFITSGLNGIQVIESGTSIGDGASDAGIVGPRLARAYPNPASGAQRFELLLPERAPLGALEVFDAAGRVVWRRSLAGLGAGAQTVAWDGADAGGRALPPAVYFARVASGTGGPSSAAWKLVRVR